MSNTITAAIPRLPRPQMGAGQMTSPQFSGKPSRHYALTTGGWAVAESAQKQ